MSETERALATLQDLLDNSIFASRIDFALEVAIEALREKLERENGCEYCKVLTPDCCGGFFLPSVETPKDSRNIVTNADRIRSMSDEELAEFLRNIRDCGDYEELKFIGGVCMDYVSVIEWLKQPAKEKANRKRGRGN